MLPEKLDVPKGHTDRFVLRFESASPERDAETLVNALKSPIGRDGERHRWPFPGEWRVGYDHRSVSLMIDAHTTNELRRTRVGLFRVREWLTPVSRAPEIESQLRDRWPFDFPIPQGKSLGPVAEAVQ